MRNNPFYPVFDRIGLYNLFVRSCAVPVLGVALLASSCVKQTEEPAPKPPTTDAPVTSSAHLSAAELAKDDLGRTIKLAKLPERIITIGPGATEMVYALGLGKKLVGRDSSSDYPAEAKKVASVADFRGPFFESVLAVKPDFIIVQGETWGSDRIEAWQKKCGAPVAVLSATTITKVAQGMERIDAWVTGKPDDGQKLAQALLAKPDSDKPAVSQTGLKGKALFEIQRSPLMVAGKGTLLDDVIQAAGLTNAAAGVEGYKQFNLENLLADPPDYYVVTVGALAPGKGYPTAEQLEKDAAVERHKVQATPIIRELACVKAGRILVIPADWALRPGPRLKLAVDELATQAAKLAPEKK
jgi:iron complex transport system substrate-binding protein